jgi:RNA exonuclease 4
VGHSLDDDFLALKLNDEEYQCEFREISDFPLFVRTSAHGVSEKRKLKDLAREFLNASIQTGHHSSVIDARIALALYRQYQKKIDEIHQEKK